MSHYTSTMTGQWRSLDRQWTDLDGQWTNPKHSDLCQPEVIYTLIVTLSDILIKFQAQQSQPTEFLLIAHYFGKP